MERSYQRGMKALEERQWDKAVQDFDEIARAGSARANIGPAEQKV